MGKVGSRNGSGVGLEEPTWAPALFWSRTGLGVEGGLDWKEGQLGQAWVFVPEEEAKGIYPNWVTGLWELRAWLTP